MVIRVRGFVFGRLLSWNEVNAPEIVANLERKTQRGVCGWSAFLENPGFLCKYTRFALEFWTKSPRGSPCNPGVNVVKWLQVGNAFQL